MSIFLIDLTCQTMSHTIISLLQYQQQIKQHKMQAEQRPQGPTAVSQPVFKLLKWNLVASWASQNQQITCDICKNQLKSYCMHCINKNDPNIVCMYEEGTCRHAFHSHCLQQWFENSKRHQCLTCKGTWNAIKRYDTKQQA